MALPPATVRRVGRGRGDANWRGIPRETRVDSSAAKEHCTPMGTQLVMYDENYTASTPSPIA
jgi:hypothetical protein